MIRESAGESGERPGVRFGEALRFWFKLGFISFGGPAGQIAILHRELVDRRRWISEGRFLHALNYCMLLPGPEAQQLATYTGWLLHGARGGLAAGIFFVLPSILILFGLSYGYAAYRELPLLAGLLSGFKAVVVAIVGEAVLRFGRRALRGKAHVLLAGGAFSAIYFGNAPFPLIVLTGALIGVVAARVWPTAWISLSAPRLQDGTAAPDHGSPSLSRAMRMLACGLILWSLPFAALGTWLGWESVPSQQYRFYTGAALVTFGGAYAVLAYVTQAAVHAYGWITPVQAVDGLALAETTPGPLIMVLQFVGFMTGWNHPEGLSRLSAATLGALATTWVTFLPCFLFVLVGAPYIEMLHGNRALGAALSAVTASVIGVILNLALVLGAAVILPDGVSGDVAWFSALLAGAALFAMLRYRIDALWIVLAGGLAGLARALLIRLAE